MSRSFEVDGILMYMWSNMEDTCKLLNKIPSQSVVTLNAILEGCAIHGHGKEALKHLEWMCEAGQPNDITFVCPLSACRHAGLVDERHVLLCFNDHRLVYDFSKI
jgi:hypothetical protein